MGPRHGARRRRLQAPKSSCQRPPHRTRTGFTCRLLESFVFLAELCRRSRDCLLFSEREVSADAIRNFELAVIATTIATTSEAEINTKRDALEKLIADTPRWPSGSLSIIQQRFTKAASITLEDQAKNTQSLRILTVRAEILAGKETPATDKLLRMNYQVQQMQQAFGSRDNSFSTMVLEWIAIGGVPTDTYTELLSRFNSSRETGAKK